VKAILDPGISGPVTAASIKMRAEIVLYGFSKLRGMLYSMYLQEPYEFTSLLQMIEKMEEIFDSKSFPEAFLTPRTFGSAKNRAKKYEVEGNDVMKDAANAIVQPESGGSKCTFEITVKFRQNATWQGQILWAEKNMKQNFRSVLEMLKLMDEALSDGELKSASVEWGE